MKSCRGQDKKPVDNKSDAMLDTLQKMSGITHRVYRDGKAVTRDMEKLILQNEGKVTINLSVKEQPVISYNDMAFMPMCNSIVFRAGDSPIWNRNETCLPMSWRLFANTISQPGKKYSLQTVPTLSSALDFDVRKNMPDFFAMWEKRRNQALEIEDAIKAYKEAYGFTDTDIARLDPDKFADEIMAAVNRKLGMFDPDPDDNDDTLDVRSEGGTYYRGDSAESFRRSDSEYEDNMQVIQAAQTMQAENERWGDKIYCGGLMSRDMLCPLPGKAPNHQWDDMIIQLYRENMAMFSRDGDNFHVDGEGTLRSQIGNRVLIQRYSDKLLQIEADKVNEEHEKRMKAFKDAGCEIETEKYVPQEHDGYKVTDDFYRFIIGLDKWSGLCDGQFEIAFTDMLKGSSEIET